MLLDKGLFGEISTEDYEKCKLIWRKYRFFKSESRVIRSGFGIYGVYDFRMGERPVGRPESDLEHTAGVTMLLMLVSLFFEKVISQEEAAKCIYTAMIHELGECVYDDTPDDGTRDNAEKDRREFEVIDSFTEEFPPGARLEILQCFHESQTKKTQIGQVIYMGDKLDAILQGLIYEADGRGGDIMFKVAEKELSAQYQEGVRRSRSHKLVDVWSVHFFDSIAGMQFAEIFVGVLRAAVEDVRGEWFDWVI